MVARSPLKQRKIMAALNPVLLRETVQKVDRCMARLQELQYTVSGGNKVISGVSLSPRSTRGYLRTSLRCKQESIRIKNSSASRKSPVGKFPANSGGGEWQRMSLPAMLVGETIGEILQASQFAKQIVAAMAHKTNKITSEDPKTPVTQHRKQRPILEETELRVRRKNEKQTKPNQTRSASKSPTLRRARSRINFKVSPPNKRETDKENSARYNIANRVSPRHKPWAKKAVLFPNPLFSSSETEQNKFCKTRSPVIARNNNNNNKPKTTTTHTSPHKFLIKSPKPLPSSSVGSKFQVKIKSPPRRITLSPPIRASSAAKKSPKKISTASKLRRSFSPSRLANRLVALSPLKSRRSSVYNDNKIDEQTAMSGLKQRPSCSIPMGISARRI